MSLKGSHLFKLKRFQQNLYACTLLGYCMMYNVCLDLYYHELLCSVREGFFAEDLINLRDIKWLPCITN